MKRQRFIARKQAEAGGGGYARQQPYGDPPPPVTRETPDALSQLVSHSSHISAPQQASLRQPYGERPSSGSRGSQQNHDRYSGNGCGFDGAVVGQWNANVQQTRLDQQSRHDPNISGPSIPTGGQRVTQAPGGGSSIDLSWNGNSSKPPQMPGPPSSVGRQGPSPSHGSRSQFASPWGREDDNLPARQIPSQRDSCPFGTDTNNSNYPPHGAMRSDSRGRGNSPMNRGEGLPAGFAHPRHTSPFANEPYAGQNIPQAPMQTGSRARGLSPMNAPLGKDAPPAGAGISRGAFGRQAPGGNSQVVFG